MSTLTAYLPQFLVLLGILVAITNIITEVLKKLLPSKIPTNITATVVSMVLTFAGMLAGFSYYNITMMWYYYVAIVVLGFMVAYAAMFGFDKLKEILLSLGLTSNTSKTNSNK